MDDTGNEIVQKVNKNRKYYFLVSFIMSHATERSTPEPHFATFECS